MLSKVPSIFYNGVQKSWKPLYVLENSPWKGTEYEERKMWISGILKKTKCQDSTHWFIIDGGQVTVSG